MEGGMGREGRGCLGVAFHLWNATLAGRCIWGIWSDDAIGAVGEEVVEWLCGE